MTQLKINDNELVQSDREILHECETFYKNLYSSKTQVNDFPEDFFPPERKVLNNEKRSFCEGQLTAKECLEALKDMTKENHLAQMACHVNSTRFSGKT